MPRSWVAGGWRGVAAAVAGVERRRAMAIVIPTREVTCSVTAMIGSSGHRSGSKAGRRHDATSETGSAAASAWVSSVVLEGVRRHVIAVGVDDEAGFSELLRSFALLFGRLAPEAEQGRLRAGDSPVCPQRRSDGGPDEALDVAAGRIVRGELVALLVVERGRAARRRWRARPRPSRPSRRPAPPRHAATGTRDVTARPTRVISPELATSGKRSSRSHVVRG